jgi:hypothetical protein
LKTWGVRTGDRSPLEDWPGDTEPDEAEVDVVGVNATVSERAAAVAEFMVSLLDKK